MFRSRKGTDRILKTIKAITSIKAEIQKGHDEAIQHIQDHQDTISSIQEKIDETQQVLELGRNILNSIENILEPKKI